MDTNPTDITPPADDVTPEKVAFIEGKVGEYFRFVLDSFERICKEARTLQQWLFTVVIGGLALIGPLVQSGYWPIALGPLFASAWAAFIVHQLMCRTKTRDIVPPGNYAAVLDGMINDPVHWMRFNEALATDGRIRKNNACVRDVALAVDAASDRFTLLPAFFVGGIAIGYAVKGTYYSALWLFR